MPWAARAAISTPIDGASAQAADDAVKTARPATSTRRRPSRSPTGFARGASFRFAQTRANGQPALGLYRRRNGDAYRFLQVQVLTMTETGIAQIDGFHVNRLYAQFGLPAVLAD